MILQYFCNSGSSTPPGLPTDTTNQGAGAGEGPVRDGTDNATPDPNNPDANSGLHEPASFYNDCKARERNNGLYTADQNADNNVGATATRQNPNGDGYGQECQEERVRTARSNHAHLLTFAHLTCAFSAWVVGVCVFR